jgi:hypothetical protein
MPPEHVAEVMRGLTPILLFALLAGCASNAATPIPAQQVGAPTHVAGRLWMDPQGAEPIHAELPFPVNASGEAVVVTLHLGSRYAVDLPTSTAEVTVQLVGPTNETMATATLHGGALDATLRARASTTGTHKLVLLSYGGSDGGSMGDHVDYAIDAGAAK